MGTMISTVIDVGLKQIKCRVVSTETNSIGTSIGMGIVQIHSTYLYLSRNDLLTLREELIRLFSDEETRY